MQQVDSPIQPFVTKKKKKIRRNIIMERRNNNSSSLLNPKAIFICSCYLIIIIIIIIPSASSYPVINSNILSRHPAVVGGSKLPSSSSSSSSSSAVGLSRQWQLEQRQRQRQQQLQPRSINDPNRLQMSALSYSDSQAQDGPDYFYSTITSRLPIQSLQKLAQTTKTKLPLSSNNNNSTNNNTNDNNTNDDDNTQAKTEETKSSWLRWMKAGYSGKSTLYRNTAEIKMRDPPALGGLPRSARYGSSDWLHNTLTLPNSAILKAIRGPVLSMTVWGFVVGGVYKWLMGCGRVGLAKGMCITAIPHRMMVRVLALLLAFRTNSAYQRFAEGRKIWEIILNTSRDISRMAKLYESSMGSARLRRVQRLLAAFPYLLGSRIRPSKNMKRVDDPAHVRDPEFSLILYSDHATSDSDADAAAVATDEETIGISRRKTRELYWVDKRTLPWRLLPSLTKEECARAQNRPLWVCDRMAKELHSIPQSERFTARERLMLVGKVEKLSNAIGACERIHQTVVPLNYARHALRSLTVWLLSLPFALVEDMGLMTGVILFVMSWMLFGVYEIGCSIEDPFQGALRLSILCDAIRRDMVGEEIIRNTAFEVKDEVLSSKEGVELKQDDYLEDDLDRYDDDDEDYGAKEDMYKVQIENIMIDSMGIPHVMQDSESQKPL